MKRARQSADSGFTLIELLISIAITGLIVGVLATAVKVSFADNNAINARYTNANGSLSLTNLFPTDIASTPPGGREIGPVAAQRVRRSRRDPERHPPDVGRGGHRTADVVPRLLPAVPAARRHDGAAARRLHQHDRASRPVRHRRHPPRRPRSGGHAAGLGLDAGAGPGALLGRALHDGDARRPEHRPSS